MTELDESTADEPHERRESYDPADIATDAEIDQEKIPPVDDVAAWTKLCAPFLELVSKHGPQHLRGFKVHAVRMRPRFKTKLAEECVFWLERQGQLVKFKRWDGTPAWRLPGFDAQADAPDEPPRKRATESKPLTRSAAMASKEYVSTEEAAKILGVGVARAMFFARTGEVKARKVADFAGKGHPPWEFLRSSLIKRQPNFMAEEEAQPPPPAREEAAREETREGGRARAA